MEPLKIKPNNNHNEIKIELCGLVLKKFKPNIDQTRSTE